MKTMLKIVLIASLDYKHRSTFFYLRLRIWAKNDCAKRAHLDLDVAFLHRLPEKDGTWPPGSHSSYRPGDRASVAQALLCGLDSEGTEKIIFCL